MIQWRKIISFDFHHIHNFFFYTYIHVPKLSIGFIFNFYKDDEYIEKLYASDSTGQFNIPNSGYYRIQKIIQFTHLPN